MNLKDKLKELGFSENEARVYLALLETGETAVGKILAKTGLHPQIVYTSLKKLNQQNLVSFRIRDNKYYFMASDPAEILLKAQKKIRQIEDILPSLLKKWKKTVREELAQTFVGKKQFNRLRSQIINSLSPGDTFYVIGSGGKEFYKNINKDYFRIEKKRAEKGIKKKIIAYQGAKGFIQAWEKSLKLTSLRFLLERFEPPATTLFGGDKFLITIWAKEPISLLIENKAIVESYKKYFDFLWKIAKN